MTSRKLTVLLGAGASIDAGLPDAYNLTQKVYDKLASAKTGDATLFAIVVAKLISRNAKAGVSPFSAINIEDVYDGLKRFLNRDSDLLSEFVTSWDQISLSGGVAFDGNAMARDLASLYHLRNDRRFDGGSSIHVDQSRLQSIINRLSWSIQGDVAKYKGASLAPFLNVLVNLLEVEPSKTSYMQRFLGGHAESAQCIATLNYDTLVESSLLQMKMNVDVGLGPWNKKRYVRFHGKAPKLIKLHGSVDWYLKNHDEIIHTPEAQVFEPPARAMIFGGQSDKLVPYGPFLHLRHEFQRFLRDSSDFLVIGYSFADTHLNAIIRSWIATRRRGRLIVVDPKGFLGGPDFHRYATQRSVSGQITKRVEIKEITKGFAEALSDIDETLQREPDFTLS